MERIFNIGVSNDYGWEIDIVGFKPPYSDYEGVKDAPMGICVKQDDKILAIYENVAPDDEMIAKANELEIFKEECRFTHLKHSFTGNFVDALIYIQKQYIGELKNE